MSWGRDITPNDDAWVGDLIDEEIAKRDVEITRLRAEVERLTRLVDAGTTSVHYKVGDDWVEFQRIDIHKAEIERLTLERDQIIERCAQVCDEHAADWEAMRSETFTSLNGCAAAIRAMKGGGE